MILEDISLKAQPNLEEVDTINSSINPKAIGLYIELKVALEVIVIYFSVISIIDSSLFPSIRSFI
jgi:hypothetical protein